MTKRRYAVEWMEVARSDLEGIATHLSFEAPLRAVRILDRIIDKGESLRSLPERGKVVRELVHLGERSWREVQEPPWRIVYRISDRVVEIFGVLDSRRHLDDVLRERLLSGR